MLNKIFHETAWIFIASIAFLSSLHALIFREIKDSKTFFIIFVLALLIYLFRRSKRPNQNTRSDS